MLRGVREWLADRRMRRRFPDLYDDAAHRARLRRLERLVEGRAVAVVGNAQSLFSAGHGAEIDAMDCVVRINRGFPRDPQAQGSRTDLLFMATSLEREEVSGGFGDPELVMATPNRWLLSPSLLAERERIACFPLASWRELSAAIGGRRPSAGLIAVFACRSLLGAASVNLFGFDWKATKTFYASRLRTNHHDWAAEKRLMEGWAADGWLRLPPAD